MQEQGLVGNILEMKHNSAGYLHTLVEALRFTLMLLFFMSVVLIPGSKARLWR